MIPYKSLEEIELVRESAQLVSKTLGELKNYIVPGALPIDLDKIAETFIRDNKATPGFLGLYDFPNSLCISINEEVVHGIPGNKPLQNGDIISIESKNNLIISPNRLTAVVGINNMAIINLDDATLIVPHDRAESVKDVVNMLKTINRSEYL